MRRNWGLWLTRESAEGLAASIPVLCPSPTPQMPTFLGGGLLSYNISLGECNSYNLWTSSPSILQSLSPVEESAAWVRKLKYGQTQGISMIELCGFWEGISPIFL